MKKIDRSKRVIQFSPIRSGSTLVYNLMREALPERVFIKTHNLEEVDYEGLPIITTYRSPLDSLCSCLLRYDLKPNEQNILDQIDKLKKNGLDGLTLLFEKSNVLKLRYEDFYNNYEFVFSGIEKYFNIQISQEVKQKLISKYQIDKVQEGHVSKFDNFLEYDPKTHWHGKHISAYKGLPGSGKNFFAPEQLELILDELRGYIELLGYSTDLE